MFDTRTVDSRYKIISYYFDFRLGRYVIKESYTSGHGASNQPDPPKDRITVIDKPRRSHP